MLLCFFSPFNSIETNTKFNLNSSKCVKNELRRMNDGKQQKINYTCIHLQNSISMQSITYSEQPILFYSIHLVVVVVPLFSFSCNIFLFLFFCNIVFIELNSNKLDFNLIIFEWWIEMSHKTISLSQWCLMA